MEEFIRLDESYLLQSAELFSSSFARTHAFALFTGYANWRKGRFELREKKL